MPNIFEIVRNGECLLVIPAIDLGETAFELHRMDFAGVLDALDDASVRNLVMDFHKTQQFGSTALGFFVKLWKRMCDRNGRMAFCNVSAHQKEILQVTKLDHLWHVCETRDKALQAVRV